MHKLLVAGKIMFVLIGMCIIAACGADSSSNPAALPTLIPTVTNSIIGATSIALATITVSPTARHAATTPLPTGYTPIAQPQPTHAPCGLDCNPWGYSFSPGALITSPPSTFCNYFSCINNFWNGRGFVNECHDGLYVNIGIP